MSAYSDKVVADGASHYWRLGEPSGPTALDSVAGLNGTISGGVTLGQPGAMAGNTAMTFNGTTGKIVTPLAVALPPPYTFEAWIKTTVSGVGPFFSTRNPPDALQQQILVQLASGHLEILLNFAVPALDGTRLVNDGAWHHVVVVFLGATYAAYLDGVSEPLTAPPATTYLGTVAHQIELGFDSAGAAFWPGSLDEVAIYPLALTAPQIANHYTLASAASTLTGDRTTAWAYHLKGLAPPKNESERAALLGQGLSGGTAKDLTTLVSQFLDQG